MNDDEPAAIAQQVAAIGRQIPDAELPSATAPAQAAPPAHLIDEARRRHRELGYALERLWQAQRKEAERRVQEYAIRDGLIEWRDDLEREVERLRAVLLALWDAADAYYSGLGDRLGPSAATKRGRLRDALAAARAALDPPSAQKSAQSPAPPPGAA